MKTATLSRFKTVYSVAEHLIGPLLVFIICYAHHLYFAEDFVSSFFAAFCLLSLLVVMAMEQTGILLGLAIQLAFLGWVAQAEPFSLLEQILFSSSISLALVASYFNKDPQPVAEQIIDSKALTEQKEKLWQELFDARQEIKVLYQQKEEIQAQVQEKITEALHEKEEKILFLQHHLEAALVEKSHFVEDRATCEADIKKLGNHMHEMALYQETLRQEILRLEELNKKGKEKKPAKETALQEAKQASTPPSQYESLYQQLKVQFEEKQKVLDDTRKELFTTQTELETLKRAQEESLEATPEEKHLMQELEALQTKLEAETKAHDEQLLGYEEVIQGLLNQLQEAKK